MYGKSIRKFSAEAGLSFLRLPLCGVHEWIPLWEERDGKSARPGRAFSIEARRGFLRVAYTRMDGWCVGGKSARPGIVRKIGSVASENRVSRWDERVLSGGAQVRPSMRANTSVRVGHRHRSMVIELTIPLGPRKVSRSP